MSTLTVELMKKISKKEVPDSLDELKEIRSFFPYLDDREYKEKISACIKNLEENQNLEINREVGFVPQGKIDSALKERDYRYLASNAEHLNEKVLTELITECKENAIDLERILENPERKLVPERFIRERLEYRYVSDTDVQKNLFHLRGLVPHSKNHNMPTICKDILQKVKSYTLVVFIIDSPLEITSEMLPLIFDVAKEFEEPRFLEYLLEKNVTLAGNMSQKIEREYLSMLDNIPKHKDWFAPVLRSWLGFSKKQHVKLQADSENKLLEKVMSGVLSQLKDEIAYLYPSTPSVDYLFPELRKSEDGNYLLSCLFEMYHYLVNNEKLKDIFFEQLEQMIDDLKEKYAINADLIYLELSGFRSYRKAEIDWKRYNSLDIEVKIRNSLELLKPLYASVTRESDLKELLVIFREIHSIRGIVSYVLEPGRDFEKLIVREENIILEIIQKNLSTYNQKELLLLLSNSQCADRLNRLDCHNTLTSILLEECRNDTDFCLKLFNHHDFIHGKFINKNEIFDIMQKNLAEAEE